jgi:cob(I)alamin adenosyltransferase
MPRMYTRTGDKGETGLFSGERVPKDSLRVEAYGTVDELSSSIGLARSLTDDREVIRILERVQGDLFLVSAELATLPRKSGRVKPSQITEQTVKSLEEDMDRLDAELPQLSEFIFPGGTRSAAALHLARSVARRAERRTVTLSGKEEVSVQIVPYLNRLSSLLFVLARIANKRSGVEEAKWSLRSQREKSGGST